MPEPFVTMLLDLRWSSGRLLREYTVLLDPPLYEDAVVSAPVAPARSSEPVAQPPLGGTVERQSEAPVTYAEEDVIAPSGLFQSDSAESAVRRWHFLRPQPGLRCRASRPPIQQRLPQCLSAVRLSMGPGDSYAVQKGDTLWSIAERSRGGSGLSNNQMMLALYRANPEAFLGNINGLKAGSVLRIPPAAEVSAPEVAAANAEVIEQHAAWSGAVDQPVATARRGRGSMLLSRLKHLRAATEGRLQLVAPAETDETDAAEVGTADTETVAAEADGSAIAPDVSAEAEVPDDNRLVQIEDGELQALQDRVDGQDQSAGVADSETALGEDQIFADEEAVEAPDAAQPATAAEADDVADSATTVVTTADSGSEGGLLDNLWIWLAGAAAVLVALFLAWRRKSAKQDANATGSWVTDIDEDPEATYPGVRGYRVEHGFDCCRRERYFRGFRRS